MIDFEKNSYTVVKGLIEPEWCKTLYNYIGYSADRCGLKQKHDEESKSNEFGLLISQKESKLTCSKKSDA